QRYPKRWGRRRPAPPVHAQVGSVPPLTQARFPMPIETSSDGSLTYHLIAFDADGTERTDDRDALMSQRAAATLARQPVTDVFASSQGWQGEVPWARAQYRAWTGAMATGPGLERVRQRRPGFLPLLIGLHWPSLPWGDENLDEAPFAAPGAASLVDE